MMCNYLHTGIARKLAAKGEDFPNTGIVNMFWFITMTKALDFIWPDDISANMILTASKRNTGREYVIQERNMLESVLTPADFFIENSLEETVMATKTAQERLFPKHIFDPAVERATLREYHVVKTPQGVYRTTNTLILPRCSLFCLPMLAVSNVEPSMCCAAASRWPPSSSNVVSASSSPSQSSIDRLNSSPAAARGRRQTFFIQFIVLE